MLQTFLLAWAGVLSAQLTPGPNMMAVSASALGQGRQAGLLVALGVASGTLVWAALVSAGLGALFHAAPLLLTALKFVGGAYLLFLGWRGLAAAARGGAQTAVTRDGSPRTPFQSWRRGLVVVLLNPKAALMWSAVATFLFGAGLTAAEVLAFGPVAAISAAIIYGGYGLLFSSAPAIAAYLRFSRWIDGAFGLVFGGLGGALVVDGIRDVAGR